ncbi:uncharacterized protein LOC142640228 [Castanea sativa]|uniref:uncharacterized protein LOC142640228 n=1 Tax=Castanea sativa TaxID=21020 RepID=UPI003F650E44
MEMTPPKNVKEVQSLNGKVATLNRFVSRAMDKCLPFFCTLKKSFKRMVECQQAFEDLKLYLSSPPLLSPSKLGGKLYLYMAISPTTVSAALVKEENRVQKLVYYTSQALRGVEEKYPPDGEASLCLSDCSSQTQTIFSGPHYGRSDKQASMESNE